MRVKSCQRSTASLFAQVKTLISLPLISAAFMPNKLVNPLGESSGIILNVFSFLWSTKFPPLFRYWCPAPLSDLCPSLGSLDCKQKLFFCSLVSVAASKVLFLKFLLQLCKKIGVHRLQKPNMKGFTAIWGIELWKDGFIKLLMIKNIMKGNWLTRNLSTYYKFKTIPRRFFSPLIEIGIIMWNKSLYISNQI